MQILKRVIGLLFVLQYCIHLPFIYVVPDYKHMLMDRALLREIMKTIVNIDAVRNDLPLSEKYENFNFYIESPLALNY